MLVTLAAVILFFVLPSQYLPIIALGAAAFLLVGRIVHPEKIYRQIDWSLLVMFAGLFVVVHAFQMHVVARWGIEGWTWLLNHPVDLLSGVSAALSNLVSNVPAVLLFEPVMKAMPSASQETAWLALAMSSTLAGNLTVLGSVANLIVVENARREGVHDVVLGVLQGRRAGDAADAGAGHRLAEVRAVLSWLAATRSGARASLRSLRVAANRKD